MRTSQKLTGETEQNLEFDDYAVAQVLFGVHNNNLKTVEQSVGVHIYDRGNTLNITGKGHAVQLASSLLTQLYHLVRKGYPVFSQDIVFGIKILESSPSASLAEIFLDKVCITAQKRIISPKSVHQKNYIEAIRTNDIVFGIGPAGTGKTYLAVAMAVITGDVTQVDLPGKQASGLAEANKLLKGIDGIGFSHFDHNDVVRHPLVQKIIQAYAGQKKG
ncbi:MAG: hypothetical protein D3925_07550 [Candidatus Electrothrix sp. AR5]|nr:hypothetical protein [Candidatus Electrothrix sp. AR5]